MSFTIKSKYQKEVFKSNLKIESNIKHELKPRLLPDKNKKVIIQVDTKLTQIQYILNRVFRSLKVEDCNRILLHGEARQIDKNNFIIDNFDKSRLQILNIIAERGKGSEASELFVDKKQEFITLFTNNKLKKNESDNRNSKYYYDDIEFNSSINDNKKVKLKSIKEEKVLDLEIIPEEVIVPTQFSPKLGSVSFVSQRLCKPDVIDILKSKLF